MQQLGPFVMAEHNCKGEIINQQNDLYNTVNKFSRVSQNKYMNHYVACRELTMIASIARNKLSHQIPKVKKKKKNI